MPVRGTPGELQLVLLTFLARPSATCPSGLGHTARSFGGKLHRCGDAWGDFPYVREMLVVEVVLLVSRG